MAFNIFHILGIITIFLNLFLALFLVMNHQSGQGNRRILAGLLTTFAILALCHTIGALRVLWNYLSICIVGYQFVFLIGPLFYLYIITFFDKQYIFKKNVMFHMLPFFFFIVATIYVLTHLGRPFYYNRFSFYATLGLCLHLLIYLIFSFRILKQNNIGLKEVFNSKMNPQSSWMQLVIIGVVSVWVIKVMTFIVWDCFKSVNWCIDASMLSVLIGFAIINVKHYVMLVNPKILTGKMKYEKSILTESDKKRILNRLTTYLEKEHSYLDPSISVASLSKELSIPIAYISQVVNELKGMSFNHFINHYRIEASKQMLLDQHTGPKKILEIAYEVGFNSKSTFNAAFKSITGLTPMAFQNQMNAQTEM